LNGERAILRVGLRAEAPAASAPSMSGAVKAEGSFGPAPACASMK
jgi:hypothetical protein